MKTKMKKIGKTKRKIGKTKRKQIYGGLNYYTTFLYEHFLTPTLDHIFHKTSVEGKFFGSGVDCNITMLGDSHNVVTHQGKDMVAAFRDFTAAYQQYRALLPALDVFIESTENNTINVYPLAQIDQGNQQIINVGIELQRCHRVGACPFNLHWIDTHDVPVYKVSHVNPPCLGTPTLATTKLPKWIYDLGRMHLSSNDISQALWRSNLGISLKIRTSDIPGGIRFTDIHDCMKILTENCIIKREIAKATRVNPNFTYGYAKALFRQLILRPSYAKDIHFPAFACRQVLEIYTVARIIGKRMTNVIIYVGASHSTFLSQIVRSMGLITIYHVDEMGTNAMPINPMTNAYDELATYDNIPYTANLGPLTPEPENDDIPLYPAQPLDVLFTPPPLPPPPPAMFLPPPPPAMFLPPPPVMYIPPQPPHPRPHMDIDSPPSPPHPDMYD